VIGVKSSGLNNTPIRAEAGPPSYAETLSRLLARWLPQFPPFVAAGEPAK
jgi:hypothetical protein